MFTNRVHLLIETDSHAKGKVSGGRAPSFLTSWLNGGGVQLNDPAALFPGIWAPNIHCLED